MAFYTPACAVAAGQTATAHLVMAPIPLPGQARVVLTYGSDPRLATEPVNVDLAILEPPAAGACEVSYKTASCGGAGWSGKVDRDSRTGQGQEAMTVAGPGKMVVRADERGAKAGADKFTVSLAVAAYYSPATGGVRFAPGVNGCSTLPPPSRRPSVVNSLSLPPSRPLPVPPSLSLSLPPSLSLSLSLPVCQQLEAKRAEVAVSGVSRGVGLGCTRTDHTMFCSTGYPAQEQRPAPPIRRPPPPHHHPTTHTHTTRPLVAGPRGGPRRGDGCWTRRQSLSDSDTPPRLDSDADSDAAGQSIPCSAPR